MFKPWQESTYYWECVREDIENWLDEHEEECLHMDENEIQDAIMDSDSITGNMTGSYFCNSGKAKDCVMADFATVAWAYKELCDGDRFLCDAINEAWESMDVLARCSIVPDACSDVLEEREQANDEYSDAYEPDENEEETNPCEFECRLDGVEVEEKWSDCESCPYNKTEEDEDDE